MIMPEAIDVQELLLNSQGDVERFALLPRAQAQSPAQRRRLEGLVIELMENPAVGGEPLDADQAALLVGVGLWALGRPEEAIANLANTDTPEADLTVGRCYLDSGLYARAAEAFERAQKGKAATKHLATLGHAEAIAKQGKPDAALTELRAAAKAHEDDPAVHHLIGLCYDLTARYDEAVTEYEKALELAPDYAPSSFRLGITHARRGNLDLAFENYTAIASGPAVYFNALINLGVLYEDRRQYDKAIECYRRVLNISPAHQRARMYLKDAHASMDMVYDEDRQRELDRKAQLIAIPVTDFELSVRVRNCLQRMNVRTVGDLVHHTEEELLTSKNFGETSLQEIKEMLAARGLRLGQDREDVEQPVEAAAEAAAPGADAAGPPDEAVFKIPISELDLSLRSRKCMERLGIATIGQLIEHNPEELLASRNFGRTSLAEVNEKLGRYNLALKESPPEPGDEEDSADDAADDQGLTTDNGQ